MAASASSVGEELTVECADVTRLVLQFLKEQGLARSFAELQSETGVSLNLVDDTAAFEQAVKTGRWDEVLQQAGSLSLPQDVAAALHEHVVLELLEGGEAAIAGALLSGGESGGGSAPLQELRRAEPARFVRLQHAARRAGLGAAAGGGGGGGGGAGAAAGGGDGMSFDALGAWGEAGRQVRRDELATLLLEHVSTAPPSRLASLLQQALRWQRHTGALPPGQKHDIFRGCGVAARGADRVERFPRKQCGTIRFGKKSNAECAVFSPDGACLVSGSSDGFVEVWDHDSCRLRKDLPYQARDELMMHDDAVLCVAFSRDSELLATGARDGRVKVWQLATGACVRRFHGAHAEAVSAVCFARDGSQVLSGGFDALLRLHGLKSGKALREFRGHDSFVDCCAFSASGAQVLSGSSDGSVKIWDARTAACLHSFRPPGSGELMDVGVHTIATVPGDDERIIVCGRAATAHMLTLDGKVAQAYASDNPSCCFAACALSPQGTWLYCAGDDHKLYCFSVAAGTLNHTLPVHERDIVGLAHHPHRNLLATYARDGTLKLWRSSKK